MLRQPLNVLFITDGIFPFQIGGMQKHSAKMIQHIAPHLSNLMVIHPGGDGFSDNAVNKIFGEQSGLSFHLIPFIDNGRLPGHYIRANRAYSNRVYNFVRNRLPEFDLIYAQGFTGGAFVEARRKKELKIPVLLNLHGLEMFQQPPDFKHKLAYYLLRKEARYHLKYADFVYSFGGKLTSVLKKNGIDQHKILLQSNGVDSTWLRQSTSGSSALRKFVFIGRNERRKGLPELHQAIEQLITNKIQFEFHFIGDVKTEDRLKAENLIYHGVLRDQEKIISILDACDCLVAPSFSEGMPTVLLEAMSRGLALIGTDVGAVSRLINMNGILLAKPDVVMIANALKEIVALPDDQLDHMKVQSLKIVKEAFLWEEVARKKVHDFQQIKSTTH